MAGICENGHRSATDDYCDVCGLPVRPLPAVTAPAAPAAMPTSQKCPNCGASNPVDALFCEACGYDYTTGELPRSDAAGMLGLRRPEAVPAAPGVLDLDAPLAPLAPPAAEPIAESAPAVPATPSYVPAQPSAPATESPAPASDESPVVPALTATEAAEAPAAVADAPAEAGNAAPLDTEEPTRGRPAPRRESYVAEVWIDPDWYAGQDSPDQLPSPGLPRVVGLRKRTLLIGRPSRSRGITPDVDCEPDTGVSRRHAELTTDGTRWWVDDVGSSNGTYVGQAGAPLPLDPIKGRTELGEDARVYVGSWTRVVVRRANPDEVDL